MLGKLFKREAKPLSKISIAPHDTVIEGKQKYAILDTALSQGIDFPHNCRVGGCGACKCKLISGEVRELTDSSYVLSKEELDQGYILACQSLPRSDVAVEIPGIAKDDVKQGVVVKQQQGRITALSPLTHDILQVTLSVPEAVNFSAGQYMDISVPGIIEQARSYSFASAPSNESAGDDTLSFHIRHVPGGEFTDWLHKDGEDRIGTSLTVNGPFGQFGLQPGTDPIICIAGGSGMAPIKAMLEDMVAKNIARDVRYFFGARTQADLYAVAEMEQLAKRWLARFEFIPVLSEEPADSDWQGLRGLVTEPLAGYTKEAGSRLATMQAYLCGPPPMLDAAMDILHAQGMDDDAMFFDKFLDKSHQA